MKLLTKCLVLFFNNIHQHISHWELIKTSTPQLKQSMVVLLKARLQLDVALESISIPYRSQYVMISSFQANVCEQIDTDLFIRAIFLVSTRDENYITKARTVKFILFEVRLYESKLDAHRKETNLA